jgi:hypothetical protein
MDGQLRDSITFPDFDRMKKYKAHRYGVRSRLALLGLCLLCRLPNAQSTNAIVRKETEHPRHFRRMTSGQSNVSAYSMGMMGVSDSNIDRIRARGDDLPITTPSSLHGGAVAFITGQCTLRTGLSKVGAPGATAGSRTAT